MTNTTKEGKPTLRTVFTSFMIRYKVYEERQPNGQWLKSIKFKLPIIEHDMKISLDNQLSDETVQ